MVCSGRTFIAKLFDPRVANPNCPIFAVDEDEEMDDKDDSMNHTMRLLDNDD